MNPMLRIFVFLCVTLVITLSAASAQASKLSAEGAAYKRDLIRVIEKSDKIVVTEHSDKYDFFDSKNYVFLEQEQLVYQTVILSQQEKASFKRFVRAVPDRTQYMIAGCIFEPHHTIKFYKQDELLSTLQICFKCGAQEWDGTRHSPPQEIMRGFYKLIKAIGLHPEEGWWMLAQETLKKHMAQPAAD
ncbi:hypothetical protein [Undibacterium pigrum]|uniref:hypothetical protein n=1 Tax=Undibacterium pigrum TaxID=401470 RepID=UPI0011B36252|nr:hypothetical protein [Undibacterium pigrum]